MPKKAKQETQAEQSKRFRKTVRELVAAGELSPTEADAALDALVKRSAKGRDSPAIQGERDT